MKNQIAAFVFFVAQSSASAQTPIIPVMTSNSAPSGIASASSELNLSLCGQQKAWSAMDGNANTAWFNSGSPVKVGWVQYGFSTPQTAASYSVTGLGSCGPMTAARAPTEWQLICQDTGAVLDSRSGVSWTVGAFIGVPVVDVHGMAQGSIWWNYQNDTAAFYAKFYVDTEHPTAMAHAYMAELFKRDRFSAACAH